MKTPPPDFRRRKWMLALGILAAGMDAALVWSFWTGWVLGEGYPQSYVLGPPELSFNDFTDQTLDSTLPNPYTDPFTVYTPAAYVLFRALSGSNSLSLVAIDFFSMAALALLLTRVLQPIITGAWARVSVAFLFPVLSYPVLLCIDRGNIEIILVPLIAWALYFYSRHRDVAGTACLFPAICLKLYPALLLVFLLRRGKIGLAILCIAGAVAVTAGSSALFQEPTGAVWSAYRQNLSFFRDFYILGNPTLEGSASLWNVYIIALFALEKTGAFPPINLGFDGPLILASYYVYTVIMALLAVLCAGYAWLGERRPARGMVLLLLLLSISAPNGADYRLMYASLALLLLVLIPQQRRGDWTALVLIALAVIPKKEILLTFIGKTETGYADVSIQSVLNPILILVAMGILLYQSRLFWDWSRAAQQLDNLRLALAVDLK